MNVIPDRFDNNQTRVKLCEFSLGEETGKVLRTISFGRKRNEFLNKNEKYFSYKFLYE